MLGGADNPNGELPSYITGADRGEVASIFRKMEQKSVTVIRYQSITPF